MDNKKTLAAFRSIEDETVGRAAELLSRYNKAVDEYLIELVASLCNVPVDRMITSKKQIDEVRARWFYWYAYRHLTKESYEYIGLRHKEIKPFNVSSVGQGIQKMSALIDMDTVWAKRWAVIRRVIRCALNTNEPMPQTIILKITAPKGVKVELKQE